MVRNNTNEIYQQKLNQVIDYIHANLDQDLRVDAIAELVHLSSRQLLRITRLFINESLYSYITRQRMERAILHMQMGNISLSELALMLGYDNPQSFSKAFKKQFGLSAKAYLNQLQEKLFHKVKEYTDSQICFNSEVREIDNLKLVYVRIIGEYGEKDLYNNGWNKLLHFLEENEVQPEESRFIGISFDDPKVTQNKQCRFYACATVNKEITPRAELGTICLEGGKYAIYTLKGSYSGLHNLYNYVSFKAEYTLRLGLSFEEYLNNPQYTKEEDLITKVFIPIV